MKEIKCVGEQCAEQLFESKIGEEENYRIRDDVVIRIHLILYVYI
jgi:hypothetical protein